MLGSRWRRNILDLFYNLFCKPVKGNAIYGNTVGVNGKLVTRFAEPVMRLIPKSVFLDENDLIKHIERQTVSGL